MSWADVGLSAPVAVVVIVTTALAVAVLVHALDGIRRRHEWSIDATQALVLATLVSSLIDILVTFSGTWVSQRDAFNNIVTSFPAWAVLIQRGFFIVLLGGSLFVFVSRVRRQGAQLNLPAVLFLLVACTADASALMRGDNPLQPYYIVPLLVLVAATVAPRGLAIHLGLATFLAIVGCASGIAAIAFAKFSLLPCGTGKCGVGGENLRGVFDNENALALYLVLAMPFVYVAFGRRSGGYLACYFALLVLLTGSRSGAFAAVVTAVVLLIVQPDLRSATYSRSREVLLFGVLAAVLAAGLALPLFVSDPKAFTSRGYLWIIARSDLVADPMSILIGKGSFGWQHVRESGLIDFSATYSVHNQWLNIAFSAGLVGVILAAAGIVVLIVQAGPEYRLVVGAVLLPVALLGTTERPWGIEYVDWLVWALPGALLCYPFAKKTQPASVAHTEELRMMVRDMARSDDA